MPIDNNSFLSVSSSPRSLTKTQINPPSPTYSTSGQWSTTPNGLTNILDGNDQTSTTEGFCGGSSGYRGYLSIVFPNILTNCYAEFRMGIRKDSGWANQKSNWLIEISQDNINWAVAGGYSGALPATEQIMVGSISSLDGFRAIQFSCDDIGQGGSRLKVYSLKLFSLSCV